MNIFSPPYNNLPHKKTRAEFWEDVFSIFCGFLCICLYAFYALMPLLDL